MLPNSGAVIPFYDDLLILADLFYAFEWANNPPREGDSYFFVPAKGQKSFVEGVPFIRTAHSLLYIRCAIVNKVSSALLTNL